MASVMGAVELCEWERALQFTMPIFRSRAERGALVLREKYPIVEAVWTDFHAG